MLRWQAGKGQRKPHSLSRSPAAPQAKNLFADDSVGPGKALLAAGFTARQRTGGSNAGKGVVARPEAGTRMQAAAHAVPLSLRPALLCTVLHGHAASDRVPIPSVRLSVFISVHQWLQLPWLRLRRARVVVAPVFEVGACLQAISGGGSPASRLLPPDRCVAARARGGVGGNAAHPLFPPFRSSFPSVVCCRSVPPRHRRRLTPAPSARAAR